MEYVALPEDAAAAREDAAARAWREGRGVAARAGAEAQAMEDEAARVVAATGGTAWRSESKEKWNRGRAWWRWRTRWQRRARGRRGRGGSEVGDTSGDEGDGSNDTVGDERDRSQIPFAIALERGIAGGARKRGGCPPLREMATALAGEGLLDRQVVF